MRAAAASEVEYEGYGSMQVHNYDPDGAGPGTAGQTIFGRRRTR